MKVHVTLMHTQRMYFNVTLQALGITGIKETWHDVSECKLLKVGRGIKKYTNRGINCLVKQKYLGMPKIGATESQLRNNPGDSTY